MVSFLFAIILTFCSPGLSLASQEALIANLTEIEASRGSVAHLQVQNQEPVEQESEDEEAVKPYEGFNLVAFGMIAVILLIIVFVVVKVFQRMEKTRKGEM